MLFVSADDVNASWRKDISSSYHLINTEKMHYLLFYDVIDDYVQKRTLYRKGHLEHARRAYDRGELILAGALADPVDGAVLLFSGDSPAAAEAFARTDPYVTNGLVTTWRVREWTTVIGENPAVLVQE